MDRTTERLSSCVCDLNYHDLTPQTVHQVKRVLVDTLACALGGYLSEKATSSSPTSNRVPKGEDIALMRWTTSGTCVGRAKSGGPCPRMMPGT
jgi:2-methylcitrate dehydratase PrpD